MRCVIQTLVACLVGCGTFSQVFAIEWDPIQLEKVILDSAKGYIDAFNQQDADALTKLFTEAAEYSSVDGGSVHGRGELLEAFKENFEAQGQQKLSLEIQSIRPVSDSVILVRGEAQVLTQEDKVAFRSQYTAMHVKEADGTWRIASVRELANDTKTPHDHLQKLSWLVGKWRDESADVIVDAEWSWSPDGNFLIAEYTVKSELEAVKQGTHRIGWDEQRKQFRSWLFDARGGFGEGAWTHVDGEWEIAIQGTTPEGQSASFTLVMEPDGANAIIMSQRQRTIGQERQEDVAIRVVRAPPDLETQATANADSGSLSIRPGVSAGNVPEKKPETKSP